MTQLPTKSVNKSFNKPFNKPSTRTDLSTSTKNNETRNSPLLIKLDHYLSTVKLLLEPERGEGRKRLRYQPLHSNSSYRIKLTAMKVSMECL